MKIYLVGNPILEIDNLPIRLKPLLIQSFPQHEFIETDPNENFLPEENSIIIDTVVGIKKVQVFNNLELFETHPNSVSPHDYDLGLHLLLLFKLKKIKSIKIIGIPANMDIKSAFNEIKKIITI
jgi:hypothetical protein